MKRDAFLQLYSLVFRVVKRNRIGKRAFPWMWTPQNPRSQFKFTQSNKTKKKCNTDTTKSIPSICKAIGIHSMLKYVEKYSICQTHMPLNYFTCTFFVLLYRFIAFDVRFAQVQLFDIVNIKSICSWCLIHFKTLLCY